MTLLDIIAISNLCYHHNRFSYVTVRILGTISDDHSVIVKHTKVECELFIETCSYVCLCYCFKGLSGPNLLMKLEIISEG